MAGAGSIFGHDTRTIDDLQKHTDNDRDRAEQAYGEAAGTILRGVEQKSQTKEVPKTFGHDPQTSREGRLATPIAAFKCEHE